MSGCTFRRDGVVCGRAESDKSVHVAENERMRRGAHVWRHDPPKPRREPHKPLVLSYPWQGARAGPGMPWVCSCCSWGNGAYLVAPDFTALVPGQEVILRDRDGGLERLCRVRYLIAAVEPIGEFKDIP